MIKRLLKREDGASAVLIAFSMVAMMGFTAIAIDFGLGANERRQDQIGADTSVMAGAVEMALGGSAQDIVDEILSFVDQNVRPVPIGDWDPAVCIDPTPLALTIDNDFPLVTPQTDCISFEFIGTTARLRVFLPDQVIDTAFARVIGFNTLTINAEAEALSATFPAGGAGPPFVVLNGTNGGEVVCVRTGPVPLLMPPLVDGNGPGVPPSIGVTPDPCDDTVYDPDTQFFGTLDPLVYFNNATSGVSCRSNLIAYSIARGIDHPLTSFEPDYVVGVSNPLGPEVVEDDCNPTPVFGVNTMPLKTGLSAAQLRCGMLTSSGGGCSGSVPPGAAGGNNVPARLHLGPFVQSVHQFVGENMDNKSLWEFLPDYGALGLNWPLACRRIYDNQANGAWDYFDKKEEMLSCLSSWMPIPHDELFTDSLLQTPRFAWIPLLAESNLNTDPDVCPASGGSKCVHFNSFAPVYLQTMYTVITGGGSPGCDPGPPGQRWGRHDAGETQSCGKNTGNLDRLASIVLECAMMPADVCTAAPSGPGGNPVPTLELTK